MTAVPASQVIFGATFWVATSIFVLSYALIISEKIHKTIVAIVGASAVLILKILTQGEAFGSETLGIDWNVIFLLIAMMIIINLMKPSGLFEYIAIRSAKLGRGQPVRILVIFSCVTAFISAFLDNVTTVLLIAPVIMLIADALELDPVPFLISAVLASNIGGTATLIGDPPNIMIGSKAKLDFVDFLVHMTPAVVIMMVVFVVAIRLMWRDSLTTRPELSARIMRMNEREAIKDPVMVVKSLVVLGLVIVGFVLHGILHYEPATIALAGAGLLLLISRTKEPHHVLGEVEWSSIFFFIGLFIIVGAVVKVGLITWMSTEVLAITKGNMFATSMLLMWFSAFASAIIDNIPYVATMNPLIVDMASQLWPHETGLRLLQHPELMPLWWSLALGACLGGNGTAIGASANVIVIGMAEKAGHKITFMRFMRYGMPIMILTVAVSTVYVWLRYFVIKF